MRLMIVVLVLVTFGFGQIRQVPALSEKERLDILMAQNELLMASDALKNSAEYKRVTAAQEKLNALAQGVYESRKITNKEYSLCDGPGVAPCNDVAVGDIQIRKLPPVVEKK